MDSNSCSSLNSPRQITKPLMKKKTWTPSIAQLLTSTFIDLSEPMLDHLARWPKMTARMLTARQPSRACNRPPNSGFSTSICQYLHLTVPCPKFLGKHDRIDFVLLSPLASMNCNGDRPEGGAEGHYMKPHRVVS